MAGGRSLGPKGFLTEEEKRNMPKVTKALLLRILSYLKPYWLQFLFVFVAILLSATVGLLPAIITGRIVDQALVGEDLGLLIRLLIMAFCALGMLLLCISRGLTTNLQSYCLFALIPLALYNGRPGIKRMKYGFYVFYPLHLIVIFLLEMLLRG